MKTPTTLIQELKKSGASKAEAKALASFARQLKKSDLGTAKLSEKVKYRTFARLGVDTTPEKPRHNWFFAIGAPVMSVFVLSVVMVFAQDAQPGHALYGIKKITENTRVSLQPGFIDTVVERRQSELDELKKQNAPKALIDETEKELEHATKEAESHHGRGGDSGKQTSGSNKSTGTTNGSNNTSTSGDSQKSSDSNSNTKSSGSTGTSGSSSSGGSSNTSGSNTNGGSTSGGSTGGGSTSGGSTGGGSNSNSNSTSNGGSTSTGGHGGNDTTNH